MYVGIIVKDVYEAKISFFSKILLKWSLSVHLHPEAWSKTSLL